MEKRDNSGALFKNDYKEKDLHPDYKGKALINGIELEIGAWIKKDKNGKNFFSLSFNSKYEKAEIKITKQTKQVDLDDTDEIPF